MFASLDLNLQIHQFPNLNNVSLLVHRKPHSLNTQYIWLMIFGYFDLKTNLFCQVVCLYIQYTTQLQEFSHKYSFIVSLKLQDTFMCQVNLEI